MLARKMVSWPHGAWDSETIFTAKTVWSRGASAIEHGVELGGRADLKPDMVYTEARHGVSDLESEVEPRGLELMAAKRNWRRSDQQGSSDMKGTRVSISNGRWSSGGERRWKTVVGFVRGQETGYHVWRRRTGIRFGIV